MKISAAKTWIAATLLAGAAAGLSGCGLVAGPGETQIIRVAFNQSEEHPEYLAMTEFGEKFSEATDGRYQVQIYPNAIMGDQGPVTELVRTGALQMAMVPVSVPEGYNSDFAIVSAPYLYDNTAQLLEAGRRGVFDDLFATTNKFNFEVVSLFTSGVRGIYTDKAIMTPEDLKGYKIRVQDSDTYIRMIDLMGGVGIGMAQSEVYTATQQKVIEGGENSERVYADFKHYEVAPCFSYTNHLVMADVVIANRDFLGDMSDADREVFYQLMEEAMEQEFALMDQSVEDGREEAAQKGAQYFYPDTEPFRERCLPLLEEIAGHSDMTREIYDQVTAIKEEMAAGQEGDAS
ncbi:MAG TPA: TRAP transporter substrate-binding protein [Candidatus Ventrimonas merdavium]|nr:TRAP transporter substrate-binding protein [Candidatus Ventrimonas merdavium]